MGTVVSAGAVEAAGVSLVVDDDVDEGASGGLGGMAATDPTKQSQTHTQKDTPQTATPHPYRMQGPHKKSNARGLACISMTDPMGPEDSCSPQHRHASHHHLADD